LSWGEAASLAVLPNAPSVVYPGKSESLYLEKRNRLLDKLFEKGVIDSTTVSLSKIEDLPSFPYKLPNLAPHLLQVASKAGYRDKLIHSTLDIKMQGQFTELLNRYHSIYSQNEVHNGAILVVDNRTRSIRAYVGNSNCPEAENGSFVDIITSRRSTGSLLKPFLYAGSFDDGRITKKSLIADIPTKIAGFAPKNFDKSYMGAVPAEAALTRSLNVPAVRLLKDYGLEKFHHLLQELNLKSINKGPEHYGLSLILGGAESSLFELVGAYSGMASQLNHYYDLNGQF
jgi:penicillin-binding protein 1C